MSCCGCIDLENSATSEKCNESGSAAAGVLFGVGWAVWVDALIMVAVADVEKLPWQYYLPGPVATLAFVVMNLSKRELIEDGDDEEQIRARFWLCISYVIAITSGAISMWTLVDGHSKQPERAWSGVACMIQCGSILAGGLVMWFFRTSD